MLQFLPYALAALGGYQGYRGAKESGASGLGRILGGLTGAYGGYTLGSAGLGAFGSQATKNAFASMPLTQKLSGIPGMPVARGQVPYTPSATGRQMSELIGDPRVAMSADPEKAKLLDILLKKKTDSGYEGYDPFKVAGLAAVVPYALGAFDNQPTDIYMPGYNMSYLELRKQRPKYSYIDPVTGQEKEYEQVYAPEEQGRGQPTMGPYSLTKTRLKTGGLAEIRKFNEGGINYLPSKVSHDENDSNNYVRARGYVEDGSGNGDKDEDTMLAQLADGEFVTRADGVLGAGIIAGANPNSMKDMREKGAQYFYEQQKRFKRIFDLLEEKNGNSKQKAN
jgi:hypothetical protein